MAKILILCDSKEFGGAEKYIMYLLRCCFQNGFIVDVMTAPSTFSRLLKQDTEKVHTVYEKDFGNIFVMHRLLGDIVNDYDFVAAFRWRAIVIASHICAKNHVPLLSTIMTVFEPGTRWDGKNNPAIDNKLPYIISDYSAQIIAVGQTVKDSLVAHGANEQKIAVIYGCSDDYGKQQCNGKKDKLTITFSGRLSPEKGPDLLIEAIRCLSNKHPNVLDRIQVKILGDGPMKGELEKSSIQYGLNHIIDFKGFVNDPIPHITDTDIHVISSRYDAFPLSAIEAINLSKPLISFNVGGMKEIINDGINGYLIPSGDVDAFADKLYVLICKEKIRKTFGMNSHLIWKRNFSFDTFNEQYTVLYGKLLTSKV